MPTLERAKRIQAGMGSGTVVWDLRHACYRLIQTDSPSAKYVGDIGDAWAKYLRIDR